MKMNWNKVIERLAVIENQHFKKACEARECGNDKHYTVHKIAEFNAMNLAEALKAGLSK